MRKWILFLGLLLSFSSFANDDEFEDEYLDKFMNLRIDPAGLIVGRYTGSLDFAVSSAFLLGPRVSYISQSQTGYRITGWNFGVLGQYYLDGFVFRSGLYLAAALDYAPYSVTDGTDTGTGQQGILSALLGYRHHWEDGLNLGVGLGPAFRVGSNTAQVGATQRTFANGGFEIVWEATLGITF